MIPSRSARTKTRIKIRRVPKAALLEGEMDCFINMRSWPTGHIESFEIGQAISTAFSFSACLGRLCAPISPPTPSTGPIFALMRCCKASHAAQLWTFQLDGQVRLTQDALAEQVDAVPHVRRRRLHHLICYRPVIVTGQSGACFSGLVAVRVDGFTKSICSFSFRLDGRKIGPAKT